ncbi:MAG: peptidylprolyl isomerase [Elusimicrobiota bacterium]
MKKILGLMLATGLTFSVTCTAVKAETPATVTKQKSVTQKKAGGSKVNKNVIPEAVVKIGKPGKYAVIQTSKGDIICELFPNTAPGTVEVISGLATGTREWYDLKTSTWVKRPFYDGLIFHRVIPEFMIQLGCPRGNGTGDPGFRFRDEFSPEVKFDQPGRLAMANSGPDTNGSQLFITEVPTPWLDGKHTILGQVVVGMDIVTAITRVERDQRDKPLKTITIKTFRVYDVPAKKGGTK